MAIIDKIQLSGTVYTIGNETTTAVTSASTDNEIPTAKAVYDAIPQGGGGKAIEAGTNISITTGETADTINCTLPITATSSPFNTISVGVNSRGGEYNTLIGPNVKCDYGSKHNVFLIAQSSTNSSQGSYVKGSENVIIGSMKNGEMNWDIPSFSTSKSVVIGGGQMSTDKNNSLAIGYNANVSGTTKTNINNQLTIDTSNQVYIYNKDNTEMICLQDQLGGGGGGSSYTAGDGIDITNDVISVSGVSHNSLVDGTKMLLKGDVTSVGQDYSTIKFEYYYGTTSNKTNIPIKPLKINGYSALRTQALNISVVETSAITTSVTSESTDAQVPSAKAVYDIVGNINTILESI